LLMLVNETSGKPFFVSDLHYSEWANRRLLDACGDLTPQELARDLGLSHKSILATLLHVFDAERVWLDCLCTTAAGESWRLPTDPPSALASTELRQPWAEIWKGYERWLRGLSQPDSELQAEVIVQIPDGRVPRFLRWQILRHVLDHSQFHRGQIIGMIRSLGHTPPAINRGDYWLAGGD
jgi:uncharacterized damage-inducible protein DinB